MNNDSGGKATAESSSQVDSHTSSSSLHTESDTTIQKVSHQREIDDILPIKRPWFGMCMLKNLIQISEKNSLHTIILYGL